MHVPSLDDETTSLSNLLNSTDETGAVWSFSTPTNVWRVGSNFHTRTWPSHPPLTKVLPHDDIVRHEQPERTSRIHKPMQSVRSMEQRVGIPLLCAFKMAYCNWPVNGVNARIMPSFQADITLFPSCVKTTAAAEKFGTMMRSSSWRFADDQIRTDWWLAVAKTNEKLLQR